MRSEFEQKANELGIADMFCDIARHDFWGEPVPDRLE